jgi:ubiquitin C-terminal hydrolase
MNATLQCFFNVPKLTKYLLTNHIFKEITKNNKIYELSSSYCHLLYHVCCDPNVVKYYEPNDFKNTISWKNPLFKGINANDSKDLINFMLEEMNQELCHLNHKLNDNNPRNNIQINQIDKYSMLNMFKFDFSKNNNSIIAKNFFFITETKTICSICNIAKYNYQVLYLLEFPLELVYNYCISNNYKYMDNNNKFIQLEKCFEQYNVPNQFTGENQLYCNSCNKLANATCRSRIYSLPKTLVIILNRGKGKVFDCIVDFPSELDLSKYILCPQSIAKYQLSGVITHLGESGMSGHFIAFCKHRLDGNWYKYNDSIVTQCQNMEYKMGTPYILFYESCDNKNNVLFDGKIADFNSFYHNNENKMMNNNNTVKDTLLPPLRPSTFLEFLMGG